MPTGYTAELCEHDVPFEKFVWTCARAFGALIDMRDDPLEAPIPEELKASTYHTKRIAELETELQDVETWSAKRCTAEQLKALEVLAAEQEASSTKATAIRRRLLNMLADISGWTPPSNDHIELKKFMQQQLEDTLRHDGRITTYYSGQAAEITDYSPEEWQQEKVAEIRKEIAYHTKEQHEEEKRTAGRNLWIKQLRESLGTF